MSIFHLRGEKVDVFRRKKRREQADFATREPRAALDASDPLRRHCGEGLGSAGGVALPMCSSAGPEDDAARVEAARTGDFQRQLMELERVDAERFVELGRQRSEQETSAELERQRLEQERRGAEVLERQRVEHERPAVAQRAQSRIRRNKAPVLDKHVLDEAMLETQCGQQLLKHQNKEEEKQEAILETERTRSAEAVKRSRAHGRVFGPDGRMVCFGEHILLKKEMTTKQKIVALMTKAAMIRAPNLKMIWTAE